MEDVQRIFLWEKVELQANGRRKIQAHNWDNIYSVLM